jgi:hypothetical protein
MPLSLLSSTSSAKNTFRISLSSLPVSGHDLMQRCRHLRGQGMAHRQFRDARGQSFTAPMRLEQRLKQRRSVGGAENVNWLMTRPIKGRKECRALVQFFGGSRSPLRQRPPSGENVHGCRDGSQRVAWPMHCHPSQRLAYGHCDGRRQLLRLFVVTRSATTTKLVVGASELIFHGEFASRAFHRVRRGVVRGQGAAANRPPSKWVANGQMDGRVPALPQRTR